MVGHVYIIGAGPGDPRLLTLRGAELLGQSDVVLYDGLANPDLLRHAKSAEHVCVGKHGQSRIWKQTEINEEMIRLAKQGKAVARLKGGDPAIFARTGEEVDTLQRAGIPFEIVPGITAALAAGSYAGIPVTHREIASAVALVTGHEEPSKQDSSLDWPALALFPGTLVIYMGVTTARSWTEALMEAGKPGETPAAIVRRCSLHDQQSVHCRLDEVARELTTRELRPPVIVIVGEVARPSSMPGWLRHRPLLGKTVLVTRPEDQAEELAAPLRELGASVLLQPAIAIGPPDEWFAVDEAINTLAEFDLIIFCSRNGVSRFFDRLWELGHDARHLADLEIAVVGQRTAEALQDYQLRADHVPPDFRSASLAEQLTEDPREKRILILRASRGSDVLAERLTAAGNSVSEVIAYAHTDVTDPDPSIRQRLQNGEVDWVTITSSATAVSLANMFGDDLRSTDIASLSPVTSKQLSLLGLQPTVEANPHTIESLVESIVRHESGDHAS